MVGNDTSQHRASLDYAGCPHCGGPVDIRLILERTKRDLLTGLLLFLAKRPTHAQIREEVRKVRAEAEERLLEPLRAWPGE